MWSIAQMLSEYDSLLINSKKRWSGLALPLLIGLEMLKCIRKSRHTVLATRFLCYIHVHLNYSSVYINVWRCCALFSLHAIIVFLVLLLIHSHHWTRLSTFSFESQFFSLRLPFFIFFFFILKCTLNTYASQIVVFPSVCVCMKRDQKRRGSY